jgi:hypothetical protein
MRIALLSIWVVGIKGLSGGFIRCMRLSVGRYVLSGCHKTPFPTPSIYILLRNLSSTFSKLTYHSQITNYLHPSTELLLVIITRRLDKNMNTTTKAEDRGRIPKDMGVSLFDACSIVERLGDTVHTVLVPFRLRDTDPHTYTRLHAPARMNNLLIILIFIAILIIIGNGQITLLLRRTFRTMRFAEIGT